MELSNGTSEFGANQLPAALKAWINEDDEAAAQWATNEGTKLPPETRQFVAMTYARQAIRQGQKDLALEWAALIVDDTRKARVMKEIARSR